MAINKARAKGAVAVQQQRAKPNPRTSVRPPRTSRTAQPRTVVLPPAPEYEPADRRRIRQRVRAVRPANNSLNKAIPDPLSRLDVPIFIARVTSALGLILAPTMAGVGTAPEWGGASPLPAGQNPALQPNPFPDGYDVRVPDHEPAVDIAAAPDPLTQIELDQLPTLDVATAIIGRPVRSLPEAERIIEMTPAPKLARLNLDVSVQLSVVPTPSGPQLRGRVRARPPQKAKKKNDRKVRSAALGTRLLRGALDMFGKASEAVDAYGAVIWAAYVQDKNGDIVPALTRMSHREVLLALATNDPSVKLDVIGAVENYVLMQLSDLAIAKVAQRVDRNALDLGWNKDLGLMSIGSIGNRATQRDVQAEDYDAHSTDVKEFNNAQLSLSRSLIPILREASGSEAFRSARVSHLFADT